jgi:hypothetical protein
MHEDLYVMKDRAESDQGKNAEAHRKRMGIAAISNLNGWQRLWVILSILWIVPAGYFALSYYSRSTYGTFFTCLHGCKWPDAWVSSAMLEIINDELTVWKREQPPNKDLTKKVTPDSKYEEYNGPRIVQTCELFESPPTWASSLGRKPFCEILFERLERSGRADRLREAGTSKLKAQMKLFALVVAAWVGPVLGVYLLGLAIWWVSRGFRKQV